MAKEPDIDKDIDDKAGQGTQIALGKVTSAHGLKGQVKIRLYGDNPEILEHKDGLVLDGEAQRCFIRIIKPTQKPNTLICALDTVKDRNAAELLAQKELSIEREKFPEIEDDDEYYVADLIGMSVIGQNDQNYGRVKMVDNFGAGDLLLITTPGGKEFYLPFAAQEVVSVDQAAGQIIVSSVDDYM